MVQVNDNEARSQDRWVGCGLFWAGATVIFSDSRTTPRQNLLWCTYLVLLLHSALTFQIMGCVISKKVFVVNPDIEGQDQAALNVMYELGLSKRDIDVLYTAFWDMDADESGVQHTKM